MIIPSRFRAILGAAAGIAAIGGTLAAVHYHRLGLTLSHYDARGHLVVARRIVDSITPGWQQIGAVWLPLPHLLNALPVQVDAWYRTGASGVAISILSFALATWSIGAIVLRLTSSATAALIAAAAFALNPNVLYLQATPMTEPLLLGLTTLAVALLMSWLNGAQAPSDAIVGIAFALACLTRYEAWPVTYAALGAGVWTLWRRGERLAPALGRIAGVAIYPTAAILGFVVFSRVVIGEWFVSGDFFVPENKALGAPWVAASEIAWGTAELSGWSLVRIAAAGLLALLATGLFSRRRAEAWVALSLAATAAVPWTAFVEGHPFRIRYMVPLVAVEAVAIGALVGFASTIKRLELVVAGLIAVAILYDLRPLDPRAPMVVEAQWDRPNVAARVRITACLPARRDGQTIMASMGSLGHYMQEAAAAGLTLRDFLHEGNGDIWLTALVDPRPFAPWLLIDEQAEGGDMLARHAREHPGFLDGYSRVCEGAGLALYQRQNRTLNVKR